MKILYPFLVLLTVTALGGCNSGISSNYTEYSLNNKFDGEAANGFFHSYGFPKARFVTSDDGSAEYVWASTGLDTFPSRAKPDTYYSDKGIYQVTAPYGGEKQRQYCELRVYTDKAEMIRSISISVDSVGKWSESRCSEIF